MDLTERQKAILFWAAANDIEDWRKIYILSSDKPPKFYEGKNITVQVSRWKRTHKTASFYNECLDKLQRCKSGQTGNQSEETDKKGPENEGREGNESAKNGEKTARSRAVNFLDRRTLLNELNATANRITDIKQKTDVLKIIADLSRMKDDSKGNDQIRRFYLPLTCYNCELYKHAKEITEGKKPDDPGSDI